ncbi:MAG: VOC family protein [Acidimicrobiales bacterium]|nr:VOC family protein [Acidimicrobiales bacterium]
MADDDPFAALPTAPAAPEGLPGGVELGVFSLSLAVANLAASQAFYEKLGFEVTGGDRDGGWLILKNGETTLGLFAGMFEANILTFNPGLTPRMERLERFTDVRDVERALRDAGLEPERHIEPDSTGAGHLTLTDPDGNAILIDQFF